MHDHQNALQSFTRIGPSIFYLADSAPTPPEPEAPDVQHVVGAREDAHLAPTLIILCTWMSAAPRHIAKYTAAYIKLFPTCAQLVLTISLEDMLARRDSKQRSDLAPALKIIQGAIQKEGSAGAHRVLLHVFSHGGAHKACQLAILWRTHNASPLPVSSMVLDSTPGHGTYKRSLEAIRASMPQSSVVRALGVPLAHVYLATSWTLGTIFRFENVVQRLRVGLNNSDLFPLRAGRLYLYSKADKMVFWKDIEEHADTAEALGLEVTKVSFQASSHAGHIMEDANKYWDAVRTVWLAQA
jgi:hypothetical protein